MTDLFVPAGTSDRVDRFMSHVCPDVSRTSWRRAIDDGLLLVDGKSTKPSRRLEGGECISYSLPSPPLSLVTPQAIELDIVYEDEWLAVINKRRGMVVHPAPGHPDGTLVNALLARYPSQLSQIGGNQRPGIVHRIDKDTSGLILAVKNDAIHTKLAVMLKKHAIGRQYEALIYGRPDVSGGTIDAPIGRDPFNRQKMAVVAGGKPAVTHFKLKETLSKGSHLQLELETGRTHQIRVHLAFLGLPVVGDPLYAKGRATFGMKGQALHAARLTFSHPQSGETIDVYCPPPADFLACKKALQA